MDLHLFLISPDPALCTLAAEAATGLPVHLQTAPSVAQMEPLLRPKRDEQVARVLLIDLSPHEYLATRRWVQQRAADAKVFFFSGDDGLSAACAGSTLSTGLFESGELLPRPREGRELAGFFARLLGETASLREAGGVAKLEELVGRSIGFRTAVERAMEAAAGDAPILLTGESGSGKGFFARAIHRESGRLPERFVEVDCRALPEGVLEELLESATGEGAHKLQGNAAALFRQAEGGTLYLEDVSALDRQIQARLARWLDAGRIVGLQNAGGDSRRTPLGAHAPRSADGRPRMRIIAGTRYDLSLASRTGTFDRDLFRRLADCEIKIPPLRERPSDILLLADSFLPRLRGAREGQAPRLTAAAKERLVAYPWPGNVRELIGVLQFGLLRAGGAALLDADHLAPGLSLVSTTAQTRVDPPAKGVSSTVEPEAGMEARARAMIRFCDGQIVIELPKEGVSFDDLEKAVLLAALTHAKGNVVRAARLLRLGRGSLRYRLEKHSIMQPRRRRMSRRLVKPGGQGVLSQKETLPRAS
ncbi:MAG: sigma 54-interacting transcriptional regulator [Candidatus Eisenbacteria bacterium]